MAAGPVASRAPREGAKPCFSGSRVTEGTPGGRVDKAGPAGTFPASLYEGLGWSQRVRKSLTEAASGQGHSLTDYAVGRKGMPLSRGGRLARYLPANVR